MIDTFLEDPSQAESGNRYAKPRTSINLLSANYCFKALKALSRISGLM